MKPSHLGNLWNAFSHLLQDPARPGDPPLGSQTGSRLAQLPDDVLYLITIRLSDDSKASLLRTCRYFQQFLEPILYRDLDLLKSTEKKEKAERTLAARRDLIPYIQSYHGFLGAEAVASPPLSRRLYQSSQSASRGFTESISYKNTVMILTKAANIREINFSSTADWASDPIWSSVTMAIYQMNLRKLTYYAVTPSGNEQLCRLLAAQRNLEELTVYGRAVDFTQLEPTALPKLKRLGTTLSQATTLVPGRSIEELVLSCYKIELQFNSTMFDQLALGTRKIKKLWMMYPCGRGGQHLAPTLAGIGRTMREVETIVIGIDGVVPARVLLDGFPALPNLYRLDLLAVSLTKPPYPATGVSETHSEALEGPMSERDEWGEIRALINRRCPSLVEFNHTPL